MTTNVKDALIEHMRKSMKTLGQLSTDPRLNAEERDAIHFVAGYASASLADQTDIDMTGDFTEGARGG